MLTSGVGFVAHLRGTSPACHLSSMFVEAAVYFDTSTPFSIIFTSAQLLSCSDDPRDDARRDLLT